MEYKRIHGFDDYEACDDGSIWSTKYGKRRRLKPGLNRAGYLMVVLCAPRRSYFVHRIVLETFVGPRPEGLEARHLDGDKINNALSNLAWGTRRENIGDKPRHYKSLGKQGATEARRLKAQGMTYPQIANLLDQPILNIWNAIRGKTYREPLLDNAAWIDKCRKELEGM